MTKLIDGYYKKTTKKYMKQYMSETAKVRELPQVMTHMSGKVLDYGCGGDKITPEAIGMDGRELPGVDIVCQDLENPQRLSNFDSLIENFDIVYSSHFLEHTLEPYRMIHMWYQMLIPGGKLILYLPDAKFYDNYGNPEHMQNIEYKDFIFWFRRNFCGEGKNYLGHQLIRYFELIDHGMDVGEDKYSFFLIARAV